MITPFTLHVSSPDLSDLAARLDRTRWPHALDDNAWEDGADTGFLRRLVEYWRRDYDWRLHERAINALPHFHVDLDGTRLHFLHIRGRGRDPKPLLLCHGWPSSFLEYRKISPMLTEDAHVGPGAGMSFDLVIPSLPGYGFSDPPTAPGVHPGLIARRYDRLMTEVLGYERYAAHGSDIGANVVSWIGLDAPDHVVGIHVTTVAGSAIVRDLSDRSRPLSDRERAFLDESARWTELEGGYAHLQRTRPRTISYALNDSPAGLAAWIVEKFRAWSDCSGDVTRRFTLDELLTTIMVYWSSGAIGPSMRLYYEGRLHPRRLAPGERVEVPCGVALFPHDIARPPREWGERAYRVTRWTEMSRGGHFPAHEEPELLAADLRAFFAPLLA